MDFELHQWCSVVTCGSAPRCYFCQYSRDHKNAKDGTRIDSMQGKLSTSCTICSGLGNAHFVALNHGRTLPNMWYWHFLFLQINVVSIIVLNNLIDFLCLLTEKPVKDVILLFLIALAGFLLNLEFQEEGTQFINTQCIIFSCCKQCFCWR